MDYLPTSLVAKIVYLRVTFVSSFSSYVSLPFRNRMDRRMDTETQALDYEPCHEPNTTNVRARPWAFLCLSSSVGLIQNFLVRHYRKFSLLTFLKSITHTQGFVS